MLDLLLYRTDLKVARCAMRDAVTCTQISSTALPREALLTLNLLGPVSSVF